MHNNKAEIPAGVLVITNLLLVVLCAFTFSAKAQVSSMASLKGLVTDAKAPVPGAVVRILNLNTSLVKTNDEGVFHFPSVQPGNYTIEINALGYQKTTLQVTLRAGALSEVRVIVTEDAQLLQEVSVLGFTKAKEIGKQSYNVISIDAKPLQNTTMDLGQVLNRISGAKVRETGGVGSEMSFSLNGFNGRQIKFFLDGVPIDNFGSSFQINNIPVNFADRIEVYKGVVPVWLGGDALGGAINIISSSRPRNYFDASYSYGSFNTHKSAVNGGYTSASGFTARLSAFQNYSDNNYQVTADVVDQNTGLNNTQRVRRFHDRYHNETLVTEIGLTGKKYADQLFFGITLGQNKADIQTGNRMYDVYGARWRAGNIMQPTVKYLKDDFLVKGLNLKVNGNYNFGEEHSVDTAFKRYTWNGSFVYRDPANPGRVGGESSLRDYRFRNNNGIAGAGLSYKISDQHTLSLNEMYTTFNRKGQNRFDPQSIYDKQPRITRKNILGLGYAYQPGSEFNATIFVKQYNQAVENNNVIATYNSAQQTYSYQIIDRKRSFAKSGYGLAGTYFLTPDLQLKASYERAYRLPDNNELFGDEVNESSNPSLKPENSHNLNLGGTYSFKLSPSHFLEIQANYIYRDARDYIRAILIPGGTANSNGEYIRMNINEAKVRNKGIDAEIRYAFKRRFSLSASGTYQDIRNLNQFETLANGTKSTVQSAVYKDRIPNMPYLFGNANGTLYFDRVFRPENRLSVGYNLSYVNQFYLFWPSQGSKDTKLNIPTQFAHDASIVYSMAGGKYNVALECLNLTDADLFDNYKLQKPSRSFNMKLRYFFTKNTL